MTSFEDREIDRLESLIGKMEEKLKEKEKEIARLKKENEELECRLWDVSY